MESFGLPRLPAANGSAGPKVRRQAAFELKGTMTPLTVLRLHTVDLMQIERQLRTKIAQRPQLFLHAPVLLDLGALEDAGALAVAALVSLMKGSKLVPVAATNVPEAMTGAVTGAGLGILQAAIAAKARSAEGEAEGEVEGDVGPSAEERPRAAPAPAPAAAPEPAAEAAPAPAPAPPAVLAVPAAYPGPVVVTKPVRSGQIVYAQNNDLVVLAPVNPGAQVMADGHVHIYAPLRGRAVAGAQGLPGARIFCQKLDAELVAISNAYVMADEIPADRRGRPAQISLEDGACRITAL
jgi:septum site-determining protein MinC